MWRGQGTWRSFPAFSEKSAGCRAQTQLGSSVMAAEPTGFAGRRDAEPGARKGIEPDPGARSAIYLGVKRPCRKVRSTAGNGLDEVVRDPGRTHWTPRQSRHIRGEEKWTPDGRARGAGGKSGTERQSLGPSAPGWRFTPRAWKKSPGLSAAGGKVQALGGSLTRGRREEGGPVQTAKE